MAPPKSSSGSAPGRRLEKKHIFAHEVGVSKIKLARGWEGPTFNIGVSIDQ